MAKRYATFDLDKQSKKMLDKFNNLLTHKEFQQAAGLGADIIKKKAVQLAPMGLTGNLKAGLVSKIDKRTSGKVARAYVATNPKIAPHAHLVEYGTKNPRTPKKTVMYDKVTNTWFGVEVAPMPKKPFMRPALDATKTKVLKAIDHDLQGRINKKLGR